MALECLNFNLNNFLAVLDYEWKDSFSIIGIYIDTPAFDEVTKDVASTFTDQLSTIGGTFGLLTGFSLISGVEIIFFVSKFLMSWHNKK